MSNLLVVDDEPAIRETLEYYFSIQGHQIKTASGLPEALELAEKMKPDAIVSDLMFEGGTGLMLREELNRRFEGYNPGFIIMSGRATLDSALEAVRQGVDQFLLKPLDLNELNQALDQALQKRHKFDLDLKVNFQLAEQFYHDLSMPLNLMLPRLCILMEGRHGNLSMPQIQSLSGQFEYLRQILWVMKGFYPRLLEGQGPQLKRQSMDANRLVSDALAKLESEFYSREILVDFALHEQPKVLANREASQSLIEMVLTRALAISERGAQVNLRWEADGTLLVLKISLGSPSQSAHTKTMAPLIQMVPLSLTCLEQAGLSFDSESASGPWRIGLATAHA